MVGKKQEGNKGIHWYCGHEYKKTPHRVAFASSSLYHCCISNCPFIAHRYLYTCIPLILTRNQVINMELGTSPTE